MKKISKGEKIMKILDWFRKNILKKSDNLLKEPINVELEDTLQKYTVNLSTQKPLNSREELLKSLTETVIEGGLEGNYIDFSDKTVTKDNDNLLSRTDCQALNYLRQSVLEGNQEVFDFSVKSETAVGTKEYYDERTKKNLIKGFLQEKPSNIISLIDMMKTRAKRDYNAYEDKQWLTQLNANTLDTFLPAHYEEIVKAIQEYKNKQERDGRAENQK